MQCLIMVCFFLLSIQVTGMEQTNPDPSGEMVLHSQKTLSDLPDFHKKSDSDLKKYLKNSCNSKEHSPFRMNRSAPNLVRQTTIASVNLRSLPSPGESETSNFPQTKIATLLRRSNSVKQLLDSRVAKESSQQNMPHNDTNQKKETPEEIKQNIQELKFENKLFAHIKKKINKVSKKIEARKAPSDYLGAESFTYKMSYKHAEYQLLFIRHKNNKILCFVDCPFLYTDMSTGKNN